MIPVHSPEEIRKIEAVCCRLQNIRMIDLMERAGQAFAGWFESKFKNTGKTIHIFCGNGNNGGDGLVIARLLFLRKYRVRVYLAELAPKSTEDYLANLVRLNEIGFGTIETLQTGQVLPAFSEEKDILIDALLGIGANRPVSETWKNLLDAYNGCDALKISVDMPSGVPAMGYGKDHCIRADVVLGFEYPKLAYLLPENEHLIGSWEVVPVGFPSLEEHGINAEYFIADASDASALIRERKKFAYKNNFGHAAIVAGSPGMCGAAILASRSCLRAGAGLVTVFTDEACRLAQYTGSPESMQVDRSALTSGTLQQFDALLIGPGMKDVSDLTRIMKEAFPSGISLVLDAEAINAMAGDEELVLTVKKETILTPHIREFERLARLTGSDSVTRLDKAREMAQQAEICIVLKGAYTSIHDAFGMTIFNPTGNQGMATAGSGDVLAGIITSLRAQGCVAKEACILGCYLHGLAGDLALSRQSHESMVASDITEHLGEAFRILKPDAPHPPGPPRYR